MIKAVLLITLFLILTVPRLIISDEDLVRDVTMGSLIVLIFITIYAYLVKDGMTDCK